MAKGNSKLSQAKQAYNMSALEYYREDGYYINNILRQGLDLDNLEEKYVEALDEMTKRDTVQQDTLYRVVDANTVFDGIDDFSYYDLRAHLLIGDDVYDRGAYSQGIKAKMEKMVKNPIGKTMNDKGFMSTTTDYETALHKANDDTHGRNKVVLKITGTKGAKGANLGFMDKEYSTPENEFLLGRNNSYTYKRVFAKDGEIFVEASLNKKK